VGLKRRVPQAVAPSEVPSASPQRMPTGPIATPVYFGEDDIFRDPFADLTPSSR